MALGVAIPSQPMAVIETLVHLIGLDPGLKACLFHHESIQDICSIEDYHRAHPLEDARVALRNVVGNIEEITKQTYQTGNA